ncbi:transcriptional regulator, AraC family [Aquimarina amphilecti]|uniref:Transcriptional regulator, AraC family n=1 Tax=Aquimarina amphilecti TaxID=1038014 RepID=A0A1H7QNS6_AQUAM|nr:helix-turn-helix domain-containing protein [Aquimarina amphilecti]SEL48917.1 transcriptional regulator, AraC family [Aquimarina amphilecti]
MITSNSILFTIISVFALQAIVLSALIFFKRPKILAQKFLAMLTFFYAIMALNIVLVNVLKDHNMLDVFRYVQLEMLYGIGPALYFYTKSVTNTSFKFSKQHLIHFLPLVLEFIFYRTSIYRNGADGLYENPIPSISYVYLIEQWIGVISIITYSIISLRLLFNHQVLLKQYYAKLDKHSFDWLKIPILIYASFFILWNIITEIDRFVFDRSLREYYFLPTFVVLSILCTWIAFKGYLRKQESSLALKVLVDTSEKVKEPIKKDTQFIEKLEQLMQNEKPYLSTDINLTKLSELLQMKPKIVSLKINQNCSKNFYDLINSYRVAEFKERLKSSDKDKLSLLGLAYECGFNSKSTFNHVFKKTTQLTPSQYLKGIENTSEKKQ